MATNFKPWMGDSSVASGTTIESAAEWASDTTRVDGWQSGDAVSSQKFNTVLRQNSLIVTALMKAFCDDSNVTHLSSLADVVTVLLAAIPKKSEVPDVTSLTTQVNGISTSLNSVINGGTAVGNANSLGGVAASSWQKKITYGTAAPTGGSNGDIYLQYES